MKTKLTILSVLVVVVALVVTIARQRTGEHARSVAEVPQPLLDPEQLREKLARSVTELKAQAEILERMPDQTQELKALMETNERLMRQLAKNFPGVAAEKKGRE